MKPESKQILHIASGVVVQNLYKEIFSRLSLTGLSQKVFIPCNARIKSGKNQENFDKTHYVYSVVDSLIKRVLFYPKIKQHVKKLLEDGNIGNYNYCISYTVLTDGSIAHHCKKKYNIPYSVFVRNTDINIFYKYFFWLRPLFAKILIESEYINFPNPSYKDRLLSRLDKKTVKIIKEKIRILPNGIDSVFFDKSVENPKSEIKGPVKLIFVGRIDKNKNVDAIVKAVKLLNIKTKQKYHLTLIGKPSKQYIHVLGVWQEALKDNFSFLGEIRDKNVLIGEYRKADIFVMPSLSETFGLVYVEALSQGLPLIYTKGEGIADFFSEGDIGLGIEHPKNEREIACKIEKISANYSLFTKSTVQASSQFNWSDIILEYLSQINGSSEGLYTNKCQK